MATAKWAPGGRVSRDGVRATIVATHLLGSGMFPHPRLSVLPDDRRRSQGSIVWECSEVTKLLPATSCPACGGRHSIFYCPERV